MKKILIALVACAVFTSCTSNRIYIKDYNEQMEVLKKNFPELYMLYINGKIYDVDLYEYEKNGKWRYHVDFRYR